MEKPKENIQPGDVVYVMYSPILQDRGVPCIVDNVKVDCKVLEVYEHNGIPHACLIAGNGLIHQDVPVVFLIAAKNVLHYTSGTQMSLSENTELAPKGTVFYSNGDYFINAEQTVFIHRDRIQKLNNLFV